MGDLKPCPFCGGEATRFTIHDKSDPSNFGGDVIQCGKCLASSRVEFGEKSNLEAAWNTRATQPDVTAMVEALEKCTDKLEQTLRNEFEGVWDEADFRNMLAPYRAAITAWEDANA